MAQDAQSRAQPMDVIWQTTPVIQVYVHGANALSGIWGDIRGAHPVERGLEVTSSQKLLGERLAEIVLESQLLCWQSR